MTEPVPVGDLRVDVEVHGDVALLRLTGQLNLSTAVVLRRAALKALADAPQVVVFDAHALEIANPAALSVFASVARHTAGAEPRPEFVVCGVADDVGVALRRWRAGGVLAIGPPVPDPSARTPEGRLARLPRSSAAPALARAAVAQACHIWGLPGQPRAELVASELVTHARLAFDGAPYLRVDRLPGQLAISVTAYGPLVAALATEEDPESPLGLVSTVARAYGSAPRPRGRTVWATVGVVDAGEPGEEAPPWRESR
ncbi:MAG TPA: hypothetical protein VGL04_06105 [Sporichthyaceae bacterium]|jgi:anti-anti-sigma regulatory factor